MKWIIPVALILTSGQLLAQTSGNVISNDSLQRKLNAIARDSLRRPELEKELYVLLGTTEEQKWMMARNLFNRINNRKTADSITAAIVQQFPDGRFVQNKNRAEAFNALYKEKEPVKMEQVYHEILKKYPLANVPESERISYDYARSSVGRAYGSAGNAAKALEFANLLESKIWRPEGYAGIAVSLYGAKDTVSGAILFKKSLDIAEGYINGTNKDNNGPIARSGYLFYVENYIRALLHTKQYEEALKYATVLKQSNRELLDKDELVFKALVGLKKDKEAFDLATEAVKLGKATPLMMEKLRSLYVSVNGSTKGFEELNASMTKILADKIRENLLKEIINTPAPSFALRDLSGKEVSLADYKGKVVVLDFWATWCAPCIRSFPAMQMAVDKYSKDRNVAFLFIDTKERDLTKHEAEVKKFMADKGFRFHVAFDNVDEKSKRQDQYANQIGVGGIPAKFVIDGNSNIRFKLTGFSSSNEAAVEELSQMIEMVRK